MGILRMLWAVLRAFLARRAGLAAENVALRQRESPSTSLRDFDVAGGR